MSLQNAFNPNMLSTDDKIARVSFTVPSGLYPAQIKLAFLGQYERGANYAEFEYEVIMPDKTKRNLRQRFTLTNSKGENFYTRNGDRILLPDMATLDEIHYVVTGKNINAQNLVLKEGIVEVLEQGEKVQQKRPILSELVGKTVYLGVQEIRSNKQQRDASGSWVDSPESITTNEIDQAFRANDKLSKREIEEDATESRDFDRWKERWEGMLVDRYKEVAPVNGSSIQTGIPGFSASPAQGAITSSGEGDSDGGNTGSSIDFGSFGS